MGISVFSWGILGVLHDLQETSVTLPRFCICVLHFCAAWLFLRRQMEVKSATIEQYLLVMPCFVAGGVVFLRSQPLVQWPGYCNIVFLLGSVLTIGALFRLGNSFALFPGVRTVVTKGLYAHIRHPVYLGESIMVWACVLACANVINFALGGVAQIAIVVRILVEESVLSQEYGLYRKTVPWRLVPGIW